MATPVKLHPFRVPDGPGEYLTRSEAAKYLRISPAHLSNLVHGKVPQMPPLRFGRAGRRMIFKPGRLDDFIEATATEEDRNDRI